MHVVDMIFATSARRMTAKGIDSSRLDVQF